jgi:uncharacterized membrane protein YvbJ
MRHKKEIEYLKEIVDLQAQLIDELKKRATTTITQSIPHVSIPSMWQVRCKDGCDYGINPNLGTTGTVMRFCKKCGCNEPNVGITVTSAVQGHNV